MYYFVNICKVIVWINDGRLRNNVCVPQGVGHENFLATPNLQLQKFSVNRKYFQAFVDIYNHFEQLPLFILIAVIFSVFLLQTFPSKSSLVCARHLYIFHPKPISTIRIHIVYTPLNLKKITAFFIMSFICNTFYVKYPSWP